MKTLINTVATAILLSSIASAYAENAVDESQNQVSEKQVQQDKAQDTQKCDGSSESLYNPHCW